MGDRFATAQDVLRHWRLEAQGRMVEIRADEDRLRGVFAPAAPAPTRAAVPVPAAPAEASPAVAAAETQSEPAPETLPATVPVTAR